MLEYWGYHLILDCKAGRKIKNKDDIGLFVTKLVDEIDMISYGEPIIEHFATHNEDKAGFSLVQLIETSSIKCHFVDKNADINLDIFSCKEYDIQKVIEFVNHYFEPKSIKQTYLLRQS